MLKYSQIFLGPDLVVVLVAQPVVGHAEPARGEEILAIAVMGERSRLADQRVDDVAILDLVLVPADQPRQRVHESIRIPHLDAIRVKSSFDLLADEATVDRVGVAMNVNQTARIHLTRHAKTGVDPLRRQRSQGGQLLVEPLHATGVSLSDHLLEKRQVLPSTREIPTPANHQRLIDGLLEVPVSRLVVAVLVR